MEKIKSIYTNLNAILSISSISKSIHTFTSLYAEIKTIKNLAVKELISLRYKPFYLSYGSNTFC